MKKSITFLLGFWAALSLAGCSTNNKAAQEEVNVIVAADLHFDLLPETDQYFHVVTMNRLPGQFNFPGEQKAIDKIDGVIIAGDIFDKARPEILDLYRQRYETGEGERRIHDESIIPSIRDWVTTTSIRRFPTREPTT